MPCLISYSFEDGMRQLHKLAHTKDKLTKDIEVKMRGDYDRAEKVVHVMYTVGLRRA